MSDGFLFGSEYAEHILYDDFVWDDLFVHIEHVLIQLKNPNTAHNDFNDLGSSSLWMYIPHYHKLSDNKRIIDNHVANDHNTVLYQET